jgi:hypothetical protein
MRAKWIPSYASPLGTSSPSPGMGVGADAVQAVEGAEALVPDAGDTEQVGDGGDTILAAIGGEGQCGDGSGRTVAVVHLEPCSRNHEQPMLE